MDEEVAIIDNKTRREKIINFFVKNKKKIVLIIAVLILIPLIFFSYQIYKNKNKERIANKYNSTIINFESGNSTDSVTKGIASNTIKIFNHTTTTQIPQKWKKLIGAVKEIEYLTHNNKLDIEFAITKYQIIIFQIRPLTAIRYDDKQMEKFGC